MNEDQFIERRIIVGLIISTTYLDKVRKNWNSKLLASRLTKLISNWCIEFYDEYSTAPGKEIESIFLRKSKKLSEDETEEIEEILAELSDEYERENKFNVDYLLDQTLLYFSERSLRAFANDLTNDLDEGDILAAKNKAYSYAPDIDFEDKDVDLSNKEILEDVERAFEVTSQPLIKYPRQAGSFLNSSLVRGGFVAFMGPEKRGKTWMLLDLSIRAARQNCNVAFFQAGDMTKEQQLKRICIHLAKKTDKEKYSGAMYEPVRDCIKNQLDTCDLKSRESDFGVFEGKEINYIRNEIKYPELLEAVKDNEDYRPCQNCSQYWKKPWGATWLKKVDVGEALSVTEAKRTIDKFFVGNKRRFRLSTHPSKTLTVSQIESTLDLWERRDGFVADVILIDYVDILAPEVRADFRHQENDKWIRLRGLSEKKHALVVTVTQADANSYDRNLLTMRNFSEDKRKFGHVTAMFGLNQDREGREKEIGIIRLNEIVIREDDSLATRQVYLLQNLRRGQPCLSSYW